MHSMEFTLVGSRPAAACGRETLRVRVAADTRSLAQASICKRRDPFSGGPRDPLSVRSPALAAQSRRSRHCLSRACVVACVSVVACSSFGCPCCLAPEETRVWVPPGPKNANSPRISEGMGGLLAVCLPGAAEPGLGVERVEWAQAMYGPHASSAFVRHRVDPARTASVAAPRAYRCPATGCRSRCRSPRTSEAG